MAALAGFVCLPYAEGAPLKVKVVVVTMFEVGADTGDVPGEETGGTGSTRE